MKRRKHPWAALGASSLFSFNTGVMYGSGRRLGTAVYESSRHSQVHDTALTLP